MKTIVMQICIVSILASMIMIGSCCRTRHIGNEECTFCIIHSSRIAKIHVLSGKRISEAIELTVNSMGVNGLQYEVLLPENGHEPLVEEFSASDVATKDILKLICDMCNYCYFINSDGVLCFSPRE